MVDRFNLRVYGILEHRNHILLVHEKIGDFAFTKFPGGGLEPGEGLRDGLIREFKEETTTDIEVLDHIYTTDFFQQSAFRHSDQLISVYYYVRCIQNPELIRLDEHQVWNDGRYESMRFFWVPLSELKPDLLTFPIDQHVCGFIQTN